MYSCSLKLFGFRLQPKSVETTKCLPAVSAQRYYDTWYPYPASALPAFPVRDQQDYPSPAPSCSDPSPASRSQPVIDSYTPQTASDFPLTPFSQLDSSIGPLRSTRRHTSLRQSAHHRRLSLSSAILREQDPSLQCAGPQLPDDLLPRIESPVTRYGDRSTPTLPSISPSLYQPATPVSMSPFSAYDQGRRSRTRSDSNSDHRHGTHSPTLSSKSTQGSPSSPHGTNAPTRAELSTEVRPKKKERHHKHKLCDQDRKSICKYHLDHPNARQEDIGTEFGVERSTISKILKDKDRWLNISDDDQGTELTSKHRPSKFPEVESEMLKSLQEWTDRSENITDHLIRHRALEIARSFGMAPEKFKGSSGWIENFKHRHEIRRGEWLRANRAALRTSGQASTTPFTTAPSLAPYDQHRMHPEAPHLRTRSSAWDNATQSGDMVIDPALQDSLHDSVASIQHSPAVVTYGVRYSPLLPTHDDDEPPSLAQAENALNILLHYLDTTGQHLCRSQDLEVLHHLKYAMFQHASGLPYERPS